MDTRTETRNALNTLNGMPDGPARVLAAEVLARRVRNQGPDEMLPEVLEHLVRAYTFGVDTPEAFATFSELLRLYDTRPEYFDEHDTHLLFWQFKWIADDLPVYPEITREVAEALLDDMEARYRQAGHSMAAVSRARFAWASANGDEEDAERYWTQWNAIAGDDLDCEACHHSDLIHRMVSLGRYDDAVRLGPQDATCNREPAGMFLELAMANLHTGDARACTEYLRSSISHHDRTLRDPERIAGWFEIFARGNQLDEGLAMLSTIGRDAVEGQGAPIHRLRYCLAMLRGLSAHPDAGELPTGLEAFPTVAALVDACEREAADLVAAFDARAGKPHWAGVLAEARQARVLADLGEAEEPVEAVEPSAVPDDLSAEISRSASVPDPFAAAEEFARREQWHDAAPLYDRAAMQREAAGDILGAGLAYAESAQAQTMAGRYVDAVSVFQRAWDRLIASEAHPNLLVQVAYAWAASEAELEEADATGATVRDALVGIPDVDTATMTGELAEQEQRGNAVRRARIHDILSRLAAARGDAAGAAEEAMRAGEGFGSAGEIRLAAEAFLLAARQLHEAKRYDDAAWAYESVIEALVATSQRSAVPSVLDEFVALLKATGQHERAELVLKEYMGLN
ncbi:hypothetical protein M5J20_07365 [Corynebacterium sp. TA-R-1]|uniref:Tetratricopeptide repeat protein n=1 Tax=Corynebacterium stercoris TaxID=2943490 RepID=A0ABT1G4P6_9CORY|nr:hypothetical protein [Corynebacterium stercoris]MCP1388008.1 hypothetical protein [Corynebacterium stercoris]